MKKWLAVYLRLSIEDGDIVSEDAKIESDSISNQRKLIHEYIVEHNLTDESIKEFVDDGYSGTNFDRPAVTKLLNMVRKGEIGCIIVKDISRFGRNYLEVGDYLEQVFPFMGVRFIAVNDSYDSDYFSGTTGGIELGLKSLVNELYSKDLSKKIKSSLEIRKKRGECTASIPPFGYMRSKTEKGKLVIDPVASKYVQRIFEVATENSSISEVARKINAENIPSPASYRNMIQCKNTYKIKGGVGYWADSTIRKILKNKVYLGYIINNQTNVIEVGKQRRVCVPEKDRFYICGIHEAIVSEELFQKANMIFCREQKRPKKVRAKKDGGLLQGKLICASCGRNLYRRNASKIPYYLCPQKSFSENCGCPELRLLEPNIDAVIQKCIQVEFKKYSDWYMSFHREGFCKTMNEKIKVSVKKKDSIRWNIRKLYEQFRNGLIDESKFISRTNDLRLEEIMLNEQIESYNKEKKEADLKIKHLQDRSNVERLSKEMVDETIDKILVYDEEHIEIMWKQKFESIFY